MTNRTACNSCSRLTGHSNLQDKAVSQCGRSVCTPQILARPLPAQTAGADTHSLPEPAACSAQPACGPARDLHAPAHTPASAPALQSAHGHSPASEHVLRHTTAYRTCKHQVWGASAARTHPEGFLEKRKHVMNEWMKQNLYCRPE